MTFSVTKWISFLNFIYIFTFSFFILSISLYRSCWRYSGTTANWNWSYHWWYPYSTFFSSTHFSTKVIVLLLFFLCHNHSVWFSQTMTECVLLICFRIRSHRLPRLHWWHVWTTYKCLHWRRYVFDTQSRGKHFLKMNRKVIRMMMIYVLCTSLSWTNVTLMTVKIRVV